MNEIKSLNIHQKLVEVRKAIGAFTKDTKGFGYNYVSGAQVLSKIQTKMNELGVLLIPEVESQDFQTHEYVNKNGENKVDFLVYGKLKYTWVNAEQPSDVVVVPFYYTGAQDDISKSFGSALTYAERYFIIKFFNIPTDADDPDAKETRGRSSKYQNPSNFKKELPIPKTASAAGDMVLDFGKHEGKTLREIWKTNNSYLEWLEKEQRTDPAIRTAIQLMQLAVKQAQSV